MLKFTKRCLRKAWSHKLDMWDAIGSLIPTLGAFILWKWPQLFKPENVQVINDVAGWAFPTIALGFFILCRLVMSPYWVFQEMTLQAAKDNEKAQKEIDRLREGAVAALSGSLLAHQKPLVDDPKLRLEVQNDPEIQIHCMGKYVGKTVIIQDRFAVVVTNIGREVSLAKIEVTVLKDGNKDFIVPPDGLPVRWPNLLPPNDRIRLFYSLGPEGIAKLVAMRPKLKVQTSCGHVQTMGTKIFCKSLEKPSQVSSYAVKMDYSSEEPETPISATHQA